MNDSIKEIIFSAHSCPEYNVKYFAYYCHISFKIPKICWKHILFPLDYNTPSKKML